MAEQLAPLVPRDHAEAKQVARLLHLHPSTIYRWLQSGRLKGYRLGGKYRVSLASARALVEELGGGR